MKILLFVAMMFLMACSPSSNKIPAKEPSHKEMLFASHVKTPVGQTKSKVVEWREASADAIREGIDSNRLILVFFSQEWCGWCHKLLATMNDPSLAAFINESFIPVLIDGADEDFVKQVLDTDSVTYPTLLFLSPQGETVVVINGAGSATVLQVRAALEKVIQIRHEKNIERSPIQENKSAYIK